MAQAPQKRLKIELIELQTESAPPAIPWVEVTDTTWQTMKPTFEIGANDPQLSAKGWLASTDDELWCRIDVHDPVHLNDKSGSDIWDGDFLRLALDGHGDGAGTAPQDAAGAKGPDDFAVGFALTSKGPQGWTFKSGDEKTQGEYPKQLLNFSRDETEKLTHYVIRIPWSLLHSHPGVFPTFGFVAQVRSIGQSAQKEPLQIRFGEGADELRTGLFPHFSVAPPPHDYVGSAIVNSEIWDVQDRAEVVVAVASAQKRTIHASAGEAKIQLVIPGDSKRKLRRFAARFAPQSNQDIPAFKVQVVAPGRKQLLDEQNLDVVVPSAVAEALTYRLDELIRTSPHPLFTRHLQSVRALVQDEMARLPLYSQSNPAKRTETLGYLKSLLAGFNGDAAQWQTYLSGKRALFMAYVSPYDGKLSFYMLTLPAKWDAAKNREEQSAFPLFMELHGAGNPHILSGPSSLTA